MSMNALLLVMMEPPAPLEDEFNDWYDTEHFPQRQAMPGFLSASRWACVDGWPRWVALYDLESVAALRTPEYLAASGAHSTPWSKRMLARTCGRRRVIATALAAPEKTTPAGRDDRHETVSRLLVARFPHVAHPDALIETAHAHLLERRDVVSLRGFVESSVETPVDAPAADLWLLVSFRAPVCADALQASLGMLDDHGADVFNVYVPYARG